MLKQTFFSKLTLVAIVLTLLAIGSYSFFPHKYLKLNPSDYANANYFLLPATNDPDHKKVFWVDEKPFHFHCKFEETDRGSPCNLIFMLSEDNQKGTDLSIYKNLEFDLKYKGPAKSVRIAMRDFDSRFSVAIDSNSAKFLSTSLRTKDIKGHEVIGLNEFVVAEWWIDQYNLSREYSHPDMRNVTTLSVDIVGELNGTEHDIDISNIQLTGDWITKEEWYLLILLLWLAAGAFFAIGKLIYLMRKGKQQDEKISALVVHNSRLSRETDKFRKLSTVDALTNAFNRYGIEQIVESLDAERDSPAIIIFDLDHFKRVNDRRGHDAGDRVLQGVSAIVLGKTRATDKLGRWGGEEFILICPNTSVGMATALAEKLRILIFDTVFEPKNPLSITASFGVSALHKNEDFASAFKRADEALYKAKSLGRNCVFVAELDMPPLADITAQE